MDSWNKRYITKPPIIAEKATKKDILKIFKKTNRKLPYDKKIKKQDKWISCLQNNLKLFLATLKSDQDLIGSESRILFAFLYHCEHQRNEKYIQNMKGVKKCLRNYEDVRLSEILSDVIEMLSQNTEATSQKITYIPSRKYFHYYLTRLVGCFRLFLKLATYCYEAAYYLTRKIATGHSFMSAAAFLAIVGRMRMLSLDMANLISSNFSDVTPFYFAIQNTYCPTAEIEDFPNLQEEMRNFVFLPCHCESQDLPLQTERAADKKSSKISRKLNRRLKKIKATHLSASREPKTIPRGQKKKSLKRKLDIINDQNGEDESVENNSSGFFYKEVKKYHKKKKFKAENNSIDVCANENSKTFSYRNKIKKPKKKKPKMKE